MKSVLAVVFTLLNILLFASAAATPDRTYPGCEQCNPEPGKNLCDITTSCILTKPTGQYHCACRDGYKANAPDGDSNVHYRTNFAGQETRVFVKPGVACDVLCNPWWGGCKEISVRSECS